MNNYNLSNGNGRGSDGQWRGQGQSTGPRTIDRPGRFGGPQHQRQGQRQGQGQHLGQGQDQGQGWRNQQGQGKEQGQGWRNHRGGRQQGPRTSAQSAKGPKLYDLVMQMMTRLTALEGNRATAPRFQARRLDPRPE